MKFKIDENLPVEAATLLQSGGHDARTVHDQSLCGASDSELRSVCIAEGRIPVTFDLDFSDVRTHIDTPGCIILRLQRQDRDHVLDVLKRILPLLHEKNIANSLWVVEADRVRIRESQP